MKLLYNIKWLSVLFGCLILSNFSFAADHASERYEPPQILKATDVLPKSFFGSDLYRVAQKVKNDGLMNTYKVASKHGDFEVTSTVALYKMIVEIEAIDAMKNVEESESFVTSLQESGVRAKPGCSIG